MKKKKQLRVNMMYGADGRLRTSYFEGDAAKVARKNVKAFDKELAKYEKDFAAYASLDIESAKIKDLNTQYVYGKMGIAEKYIDYIPEGDMANSLGDEMTAIACSKHSQKLGIKAKIASKLQPFFAKQAEKHPRLQKLSDRITKAANNGRMPLTADSAAMMRIAFDKKYYNDCRRPGADLIELRTQHDAAVENLTKMAMYDGVEREELSAKFSQKLITQMQIDESLTDIYAGMADGSIRLADNKAITNAKGEVVKVGGKTLFSNSGGFVSAEKDEKGRNKPLDAWDFQTREPQSIEEILADYQAKLDRYAQSCRTEADFKRMLSSDSYKNLERNAKTFAEADCPDDAAMFKYEFTRRNLESCKNWAIEHDHRSPYARLIIPPPWNERTKDNDFVKSYSTDDYYDIDEKTEVHDAAVDDIKLCKDDELGTKLADECVNASDDLDKLTERLNKLEAENKELREKLSQIEQSGYAVTNDPEPEAKTSEKLDLSKTLSEDKVLSAAGMVGNSTSLAMSLKREIQEQYHSDSETILDIESEDSKTIQSDAPLTLTQSVEPKQQEAENNDEHHDVRYYIANNAVTLSCSHEEPISYDYPDLGTRTVSGSVVVPAHSVMKVIDNRVVSIPHVDYDDYPVHDKFSEVFDELTSEQLGDMSEITKEQYDTLMPLEMQIEEERGNFELEKQKLETERDYADLYPEKCERTVEEIDESIAKLTADAFPSYEAYMAELNKVLNNLPSEDDVQIREPVAVDEVLDTKSTDRKCSDRFEEIVNDHQSTHSSPSSEKSEMEL